jgi:hypothetical protein
MLAVIVLAMSSAGEGCTEEEEIALAKLAVKVNPAIVAGGTLTREAFNKCIDKQILTINKKGKVREEEMCQLAIKALELCAKKLDIIK